MSDESGNHLKSEASTGRWTKHEHESFLLGLKEFGKEWKKVAARVGTRTVVQTRTHAQKYFQKLAKSSGQDSAVDSTSSSTSLTSTKLSRLGVIAKQQRDSSPVIVPVTKNSLEAVSQITDPHLVAAAAVAAASETNAVNFMAHNALNAANYRLSNHAALASTPPPTENETYISLGRDKAQHHDGRKRLKLMIPSPRTEVYGSVASQPSSQSAYFSNRNKWTQPSPAACGHRKKDEVDAATLLVNFDNPMENKNKSSNIGSGGRHQQLLQTDKNITALLSRSRPNDYSVPSSRNSLQIINPDKLLSLDQTSDSRSVLPHPALQHQPATPFDIHVQDIMPKEGSLLPSATPDSSDSRVGMNSKKMKISPVMKDQVVHDDPTLTLLHHAVIDLDYSLAANLISSYTDGHRQHKLHEAIVGPSQPHNFTLLHSLAWMSSHLCESDEHGRGSSLLLILGILSHMKWPVNFRENKGGNTALHFACYNGGLRKSTSHVAEEVVKWLTERGADRDALNNQNQTPLHLAMSCGTRGLRVMNKLLELGCSVSIHDKRTGMGCIRAACAKLNPFPESRISSVGSVNLQDNPVEYNMEVQLTLENFFEHAPHARTLIVSLDESFVQRIKPIFVQLASSGETQRASLGDLQLVHNNDYIANLVKNLPSETVQVYRQGVGSALFAIDRVLMNRVRNAMVEVLPFINRHDNSDAGNINDQPNSSPLNTPLIATFHSLQHARCNRCALIDINWRNGSDESVFDNIIMSFSEPSRIFYYRPGPVPLTQSTADLQHNIIRVNNDYEKFRHNIESKLLSTLRAFSPDLIILHAQEFHKAIIWAIKQILLVADMCCQGRVVLMNESERGNERFNFYFDQVKLLINSSHESFNISREM